MLKAGSTAAFPSSEVAGAEPQRNCVVVKSRGLVAGGPACCTACPGPGRCPSAALRAWLSTAACRVPAAVGLTRGCAWHSSACDLPPCQPLVLFTSAPKSSWTLG